MPVRRRTPNLPRSPTPSAVARGHRPEDQRTCRLYRLAGRFRLSGRRWRHSIPSVTTDPGLPQPPPDVIFRGSARQFRFALAAALATFGLLLLRDLGLGHLSGWHWPTGVGVIVLACAFFVIRISRLAIIARADELVVRNVLWTYRIGWQDIVRFKPPDDKRTNLGLGLRIYLADGRVISATAYVPSENWASRDYQVSDQEIGQEIWAEDKTVWELEQLRCQRAGDGTST